MSYYNYTNKCLYCENEFPLVQNKDQVFCSPECKQKYYEKLNNEITIYTRICPNCNIQFNTKVYNKRFCSDSCRDSYYENQKLNNKKIIKCLNCSKEFETNNNRYKFCSKECREEYNKNKKELNKQYNNIKQNKLNILINAYAKPLGEQNIFNNKIINMWGVSGFSDSLKEKVLDRDNWKCYICGKDTDLHVHHIIPRKDGGAHTMGNLVTLCSSCHKIIESGDMENAIIKCVTRAINNIHN